MSHRVALLLAGLVLLGAVHARAQVRTGSYVGNGGVTQPITGLGFRPELVMVKVDLAATEGVLRTSTMSGSKGIWSLTGLEANLITSLDTDGFTVGGDGRVNAAATTYYWMAFDAGASLVVGTYSGNGGATQSITGIGFSVDYLIVVSGSANRWPRNRTREGTNGSIRIRNSGGSTTVLPSLDANGFTVGDGTASPEDLNTNGMTYHFAAFNEIPGLVEVGSYTGNGSSPRVLSTTSFQPEILFVQTLDTAAGHQLTFKTRALGGTGSMDFNSNVLTNRITALLPDGFRVTGDTRVNDNLVPYAYVAFNASGTCCDLQTSVTATKVGIETTRVRMVWDSGANGGGGFAELYGKDEPNPSVNRSGEQDLYNLFSTQLDTTTGTDWHFEGWDQATASGRPGKLDLLEATRVRARLRQRHDYTPSIHLLRDWTVQGYPRLAIDESLAFDSAQNSRGATGLHGNDTDFFNARLSDSTNRVWLVTDNGSTYSDMLAFPYTNPFFARAGGSPSWSDGPNEIFTPPTGPDSILARVREPNLVATAAGSDRKSYLFYPYEHLGLSDWPRYVNDYRGADDISGGDFSKGSRWDEDGSGDGFNEREAAYTFEFAPGSGLTFAMDGGTGAPPSRLAPFFKIRRWRSLNGNPTVSFSGAQTSWRVAEQTASVAATDDINASAETHRVLLRAPFLKKSGSQIRVLLRGSSSNPATGVSGIRIGEADPADDRNVVGSYTPILFGGVNSVNIASGGSVWSDWLTFTIDETKAYSITFFLPASTGTKQWTASSGTQKYFVVGANQSATQNWIPLAPTMSSQIDLLEAVEVSGTRTLLPGLDYLADVKPASRAFWANTLTWHCSLESSTSCNAVNLDVGGSGAVAAGVTFVPGPYGNAAQFTANTHNVTAGSPGSLDFNDGGGAVEFWYRPFYDHDSGTNHILWYNQGFDVNGNHCYLLRKTSANILEFQVVRGASNATCTIGGTTSSVQVTSTNYRWKANEWVHLKTVWSTSGLRRLRIFLNGAEVGFSGSYSAPTAHGSTMFGGCNVSCPGGTGYNANGLIDEPRIYVGLDSSNDNPTAIGYAGLTTDSREYLADGGRNFGFVFNPVDASRRGQYFYFGADAQFLGLNVGLASPGGSGGSPNLRWMYWNGATGAWSSLETAGFVDETNSFTRDGTVYWTPGNVSNWAPYSVNGSPDLYFVRANLEPGTSFSAFPTEGLIKTDILLFQYCDNLTATASTFDFATPIPTAVDLASFAARGEDGRVVIEWETASEIDNLGFHIYRTTSGDPPRRITATAIPGLGSSPSGARYRYVDSDVDNGVTYLYELEDIDAHGKRTRHGPVSATPRTGGPSDEAPETLLTFGDPSRNRFRVVGLEKNRVVVELVTEGFLAEPDDDGAVHLFVPGYENLDGFPVARPFVDVASSAGARIVSVDEKDVATFSLRPSGGPVREVSASRRGVVTLHRGRAKASRTSSSLFPEDAARLLSAGFQGRAARLQLEIAPLRWDRSRQELRLSRTIRVEIAFAGGGAPASSRRTRAPSSVLARLLSAERGLHAVTFERVMGRASKALRSDGLRLSRQGEPVAFRTAPDPAWFGPGSTLFFLSPGASANPYGHELVFELEAAVGGLRMDARATGSSAAHLDFVFKQSSREENRYYQAALLDAPDLWLWDLLFAPVTKSYPFRTEGFVPLAPASLSASFQATSDFAADPDHHLRLFVNGVAVGETSWDGKTARTVTLPIPPGALRDGDNTVEIENVGDTAAAYSLVLLDRFSIEYPARPESTSGILEATAPAAGWLSLPESYVLDVTEPGRPLWLGRVSSFAAAEGRSYLAVPEGLVAVPAVHKVGPHVLHSRKRPADYIVIAPRELLDEVEPLVALRRGQGLSAWSVPVEQVFSEYGHGEARPDAIREFLRHAYHELAARYVLLVGDATYDFKDYLGTGVRNQIPPYLVRTSYLWTVSDPALAAVHGDDLLPDLAIGRLPAANEAEARVLVAKILAYEARNDRMRAPVVLVADNPDQAGDFVADAERIAASVLAGKNVDRIYLPTLGAQAMRTEIVAAFDRGATLMSYVGHGGIHLWAHENVFDREAVTGLSRQDRQPILVTMNCLNGYFHFPYFNSLAEELLKAEGRGVVAAFSPSGLSLNAPAQRYHEALLRAVFSGDHPRLGDAVLEAQREYALSGSFGELLAIYHLLGDPALSLD